MKFEDLCMKIENSGQVLSNVMKKTFFLNGINEPAFTSMKDVLHDASLEKTLLEIRKKALSLKPPPIAPYHNQQRRHNNKQQKPPGHKKNGKNQKKQARRPANLSGTTTRIPENVWKLMAPEAKQAWYQRGNDRTDDQGDKTTYRRQYEPSTPRQSNARSSSQNARSSSLKNDAKYPDEEPDNPFQIWRSTDERMKNIPTGNRKLNFRKTVITVLR